MACTDIGLTKRLDFVLYKSIKTFPGEKKSAHDNYLLKESTVIKYMELIYQLSHEPIRKEDWHSISFMSKCWFMKPMGTHVSGDVNREQAVRYLMDMLELKKIADINRKQERIVFSGKSIYELFSMQYMFFRYLLKDMSQAECEDYAIDIQELSEMARQLQQSLSHSSEVYICTCDGKVMAFNEFICEVNDGDTYYIGGVYAYHPLLQL